MHLVVSPELLRQQEREREEERLLHKMLLDGNGLKGGPLSSSSHDGIDIGLVESELSSWSLQEEQDGLAGMQEGWSNSFYSLLRSYSFYSGPRFSLTKHRSRFPPSVLE